MEHEALKQKFELLMTNNSSLQYELDVDREESLTKILWLLVPCRFLLIVILSTVYRETTLEEKNSELSKKLTQFQKDYQTLVVCIYSTAYLVYFIVCTLKENSKTKKVAEITAM